MAVGRASSPSAGLAVKTVLLAGLLALLGLGSYLILPALAHAQAAAQQGDPPVQLPLAPGAGVASAPQPRPSAPLVSISGWFHVIWNGGPRYLLIDDQGGWTRLLLNDEIARPLGGPLALRGKRVTVIGVYVQEPAGALHVRCISLEPGDSSK